MQIAVLAMDLVKNSCSVAGSRCQRQRRPTTTPSPRGRYQACGEIAQLRRRDGGLLCGAHHLGRVLHSLGHQVSLMSPEYVQPYVKAQKNDDHDAEAIAEAATRPTMRLVELKDEAQLELDLQSLHRARDRLVGNRQR